ncbi:hypothetical protein B0H11DRAFT_2025963, partial [Mycena galericulata]
HGNSPARDASGEGFEKRGRMARKESGQAAHQFRAPARFVVMWPVYVLPRTRRSQPRTPRPRRIRVGGVRAASVRVPVETRKSGAGACKMPGLFICARDAGLLGDLVRGHVEVVRDVGVVTEGGLGEGEEWLERARVRWRRRGAGLPPKFLVFGLYRILQAVNRFCQRRLEFVRCCNSKMLQ